MTPVAHAQGDEFSFSAYPNPMPGGTGVRIIVNPANIPVTDANGQTIPLNRGMATVSGLHGLRVGTFTISCGGIGIGDCKAKGLETVVKGQETISFRKFTKDAIRVMMGYNPSEAHSTPTANLTVKGNVVVDRLQLANLDLT